MERTIYIEAPAPTVDLGRYPAKGVAGTPCLVSADIFRDGHAVLRAVVRWKRKGARAFREAPLRPVGNDRWEGEFPLEQNARYLFTFQAWTDRYGSWLADLRKRVAANEPVGSEMIEGAELVESIAGKGRGAPARALREAAGRLRELKDDGKAALATAADEELVAAVARMDLRADAVEHEPHLEIVADRPRALFGAWYEMFPRSQGTTAGKHATFKEAEARLPDIAAMGFDVLYLPPIHPVGTTHRKGRDNTLTAQAGDPGSVWAIGGAAGGHTAIEPQLGTLSDFKHFAATAARHGLEIALDFAIQCSPDHPWVTEHPKWFHHRPDGTIKFAENPPKKYQDVYPVNFDTADRSGLWNALHGVVAHWIEQGVKIFRVDNPHTKSIPFWEWLIAKVQSRHPEVIFLSEAFTRPKVMRILAKVGFTQSYTYFTWRNAKWELIEYLTELTRSEMAHYFRPNFFVNTPDILHAFLQTGGRPAFKLRLALAATLAPSYGIYSGYELCENTAVPGTEEYLHSEKYEIKARDWDAPGNIKDFISAVNSIRRENPALHELTNLEFLRTDNDQVIFFAKRSADDLNVLLIAVNLDPFHPHACTAWVPPHVTGLPASEPYHVTDLLTGARYQWGERNYVRLVPDEQPAHILRLEQGSS